MKKKNKPQKRKERFEKTDAFEDGDIKTLRYCWTEQAVRKENQKSETN